MALHATAALAHLRFALGTELFEGVHDLEERGCPVTITATPWRDRRAANFY